MVDTIRPRNTWNRVSSPAPVKKIRRRREQQEQKQFQKHLTGKDTPSDREDNGEPEPHPEEKSGVTDKKNVESGSSAKPGKRIDIVI